MKKEELRIGNYVINQTGELKDIPSGDPVKITIDGLEWAELYLPIPLTEKWLIKFGCKKEKPTGFIIEGAKYWSFKGMMFHKSEGSYYINIGEKPPNTRGTPTIEFDKVHEFQNIFAFTEKN